MPEQDLAFSHGLADSVIDIGIGTLDVSLPIIFYFNPHKEAILSSYYQSRESFLSSYNNFYESGSFYPTNPESSRSTGQFVGTVALLAVPATRVAKLFNNIARGSFIFMKGVVKNPGKLFKPSIGSPKPPTNLPNITKLGSRNRFTPNASAKGAHSVFRRNPSTGKVTHYETFKPQTNIHDPKPWESVIRYDKLGKGHRNKILKQDITTPHIHDKSYPGGIRYPKPWEEPRYP